MMLADLDPSSLANYGAAGIVAASLLVGLLWFMRHVVTVMIPNMQKEHAATVAALAASLTGELEKSRTQFALELKEAREQFHLMVTEERDTCERRHAENKEIQVQSIEALREVRHGVYNVQQVQSAHLAVMNYIAGINPSPKTPTAPPGPSPVT